MKKIVLLISIGVFSVMSFAQQNTSEKTQKPVAAEKIPMANPKEFDQEDQVNRLFSAFDRISANESKLQIIAERTASIPPEEVENSEIQDLIVKYRSEKELAERKVVSIEHYLKSNHVVVELPRERYERFSESVKKHIDQEPMYKLSTNK